MLLLKEYITLYNILIKLKVRFILTSILYK